MDVLSNVRKIIDQEVDYNSPITSNLFTDIAAAMNALCELTNVKCTELTGSGFYRTESTKSNLIIIGIGAGGGGGGGGTGSIIDDPNTSNTTRIRSYGDRGLDGSSGSNTTFGGDIVGIGGAGGKGGWRLPSYNIVIHESPDEMYLDRNVVPEYNKFFEGMRCQVDSGISIGGFIRGTGGSGGFGTQSLLVPSGDFEDGLSGLNGYYGQTGIIGVSCISSPPNSQIPYVSGAGGAGGAEGPDNTWDGNTLFNGNSPGDDGSDGGLIVYEFGF